jgi:amino-acid N-acetyltransferase
MEYVMAVAPDLEFRLSTPEDDGALRSLLASAGLPASDVRTGAQEFILALRGRVVVGCVGLERSGEAGLLRSFAVLPELRNRGLGAALYDRIAAHAVQRGVTTAYVLTTTAERFCRARGFERIERKEVPAALAATPEFALLCPASAVCLRRRLDGESRHGG